MANLKPDLERVRYWPGQLLKAADLREQIATDAELRRLHDAGAHGATGVAVGLSVSLAPAGGVPSEALVARGLAYDALSRALVLTSDRRVPLPSAGEGPHTLVIFADPSAATGVGLHWRPRGDRGPRQGVALAVLEPPASGSDASPRLAPEFRPVVARPLARPYTVQGQTIPGQTSWQPWKLGDDEIGVQVQVDTSLAGFTSVPHYFAAAVPGRVDPTLEAAWFASIVEPRSTEFTLRLMLRGLASQSFVIADPRPQVHARQSLGAIEVDDEHGLVLADPVVRIAPIVSLAKTVVALAGNVATLEGALPPPIEEEEAQPGDEPGVDADRLGVCVLPRIATVTSTSDNVVRLASNATRAELKVGDVVATATGESAHWTDVRLVVSPRVVELGESLGDAGTDLAKVTERSTVSSDPGFGQGQDGRFQFAVQNPGSFQENDTIIRIVVGEPTSVRGRVVGKNGDVLIVDPPLTGLKKDEAVGVLSRERFDIGTPLDPPWQRIRLSDAGRFRVGDLVSRWGDAPSADALPRIEFISDVEPEIVLNGTIPRLGEGERLAAATFTTRATVLGVVDTGTSTRVRVDNAGRFPASGRVARLDGRSEVGPTLAFDSVADGELYFPSRSTGLSPGQVIGLYEFPRFVEVSSVGAERTLTLVTSLGLRERDVLVPVERENDGRARPNPTLALIERIEGNDVHLTEALPDIEPADRLFVASMGSPVTMTDEPDTQHRVELDDPFQLREGDAVGRIQGWRQVDLAAAAVAVTAVNVSGGTTSGAARIALASWPDGLLPGDVLGLPSQRFPILTMRLEEMPELVANADRVSLDADDTLLGRTVRASGLVLAVDERRVTLYAPGTPGELEREYRPDDVDASARFLRGSALKLIRNQDLFVSWFACADLLPMPRQWPPSDGAETDVADCPCASAKES